MLYCLLKNIQEDLGMVAHVHDSSRKKIPEEANSWQCEGVGSCLCGLPHPHEHKVIAMPNISCFKNMSKDNQEVGRNVLLSILTRAKNGFPKSPLDHGLKGSRAATAEFKGSRKASVEQGTWDRELIVNSHLKVLSQRPAVCHMLLPSWSHLETHWDG